MLTSKARHFSIPFPHLIHAAETPQSSLAASSATIASLDFLLNLVLRMELQFFGKVVSTRPLRNKAFSRESNLPVNVRALFTHHSSLLHSYRKATIGSTFVARRAGK